ncbi:RCC1 and BTB domain-containing protein 1-like [Cydia splendana]|uniref:RCC1 and BTB domain-containing protein 1-like n=1 Tax=Cydia splendana TaxID=1100963 RepID=UPI0028F48AA7
MSLEISYKRILRGPCMKLAFSLIYKSEQPLSIPQVGQGQFDIDDLVDIRLQFDQKIPATKPTTTYSTKPPLPVTVNISTKKTDRGKDVTVKFKVLCTKTKIVKQFICTDTWTDWVELGKGQLTFKDPCYTLDDIEVLFTVTKSGAVSFADLYDDTDIIDFNLSLEDNKVPVHKACLAAHSNKFKNMFTSVWKDINEGCVEIKGATHQTLQYIKDYMYLGRLPDVDVRPMLLFAIQYSMSNLKADCITKLVETVEFYSLYSLLEFACENNIPELTFALMLHTSAEMVHNAYEMKKNPPLEEPLPDA